MNLHLPAGSAAEGDDPVVVTPARAGWTYSGLSVIRLRPGERRTIETGPDEMLILPLSGSCEVVCDAVYDMLYNDGFLDLPNDWRARLAVP